MQRSLIAPTAHPRLEHTLRMKLERRGETSGSLGELEPLAVRLGLIQNTLKPRLQQPQLLVFAGDHGLVVDGISAPGATTLTQVEHLLGGRLPMAVFSFIQGMTINVVDAGLAHELGPHPALLQRKIAFGTRNARVASAMSVDQAHAAIRAGMEIADSLPGNVLACAGVGVGAHESAALVLSRLAGIPIQGLITDHHAQPSSAVLALLEATRSRHHAVSDPVEVLAAFGGFEVAMMVGAMLVAASKRHVIMVDGFSACAALLVAARIAAPVTDYAVFCRSTPHEGLDHALRIFRATALLELGMNATDGTGATLTWPLVHAAAALLTEVAEGEETGPSRLSTMTAVPTLDNIVEPDPPGDETPINLP